LWELLSVYGPVTLWGEDDVHIIFEEPSPMDVSIYDAANRKPLDVRDVRKGETGRPLSDEVFERLGSNRAQRNPQPKHHEPHT
jgi:hypothetical protein